MNEVPDYNPNGTANPKGDAVYWRARAEQAEVTLYYAQKNWMAAVDERDELRILIRGVYDIVTQQLADPTGDTAALVKIATRIEEVING